MSSRFEIGERDFLLDGAPMRILSGALHYFRVHPDSWEDRIHKARLMGLNTIETYVAWNVHATSPDRFDTSGPRDLGRFLDLVAEEGMHALVRPGPYICAEWDNGGLPAWLTARPGISVRSSDADYLAAAQGYFAALAPIIVPRLVDNGGPILAVQVENEYGAYGSDADYLRALVAMLRSVGVTVPMFTCDQANDEMLSAGGLPELLRTATFGSRSRERLEILRRHQPSGPLMCMEYWNGWFDRWGLAHHRTDVAGTARDLDELLATGASVNLYMFHGGSNPGLTNGANDSGVYLPITTSYDYDAPLSEDGSPTPKYAALRQVIARHADVPAMSPAPASAAPRFTVPLERRFWSLGAVSGAATGWTRLPPAEEAGHRAGMVAYRIRVEADDGAIVVGEVRDRALVQLDGDPVGVLSRTSGDHVQALPARSGELTLLVEDQGRVSYGARLGEAKGLVGPVRTMTRELTTWDVAPLELDPLAAGALAALRQAPTVPADVAVRGPVLVRGAFRAPSGADLFWSTDGWGKGFVWINGVLLGRYWSAGPTRTLHVPGPLVRAEGNEMVVLELSGAVDAVARFVGAPELGPAEI